MVGNGPAIARIRAWAEAWTHGVPPVRALVLAGPPGTGKTSAALAVAADMGWPVIELNASDARNAGTIKRVATAGALNQTFASDGAYAAPGTPGAGRKLIILDEADNLYERGGADAGASTDSDSLDKGGKTQIVETLRLTRQPILLIVNDLYALEKGSGSAIRTLAETVKFQHLQARSIVPALERIAKAESVQADRETLELIAARAEGDMRAAVRDLESLCLGRASITRADVAALGARDTSVTLYDLVRHILKGRPMDEVRRETFAADASPEDLVLWIDENLPKEYRDPRDLAAGYEMLAKADRFLGRAKSTQDYGLWGYAGELATVGVMASRDQAAAARAQGRDGFVPFGFPQWLSRMSRTKGMRQTKDHIAQGLGRLTHASRRKTRTDQAEAFASIFALDREFAVQMTYELGLEDEEVAMLLGKASTVGDVKAIRAAVTQVEEAQAAAPSRPAAREPAEALASSRPGAKPPEPEAPAAKPTPAQGQKRLF